MDDPIDVQHLDECIDNLESWIHLAASSLLTFYIPKRGAFWRDNFAPDEEAKQPKKKKYSPTSTHRSFFALREYLRFLAEENIKTHSAVARCSTVLKEVSERYLSLLPSNPSLVRDSATNQINAFTDSHLLLAVACLRRLHHAIDAKLDLQKIEQAADQIARENRSLLRSGVGVRLDSRGEAHDFITLHTVRGLEIYCESKPLSPNLLDLLQLQVKERVLRQLAFDYSKVSSKFDASELAFSVELLIRFTGQGIEELASRAISSVAQSQGEHGGWPAPRLVWYRGKSLLHIASVEVALSLSHVLLRAVRRNAFAVCKTLLACLGRSYDLVRSSYNSQGPFTGWSNDHARTESLSESWTTAIVLTFLIHYRDALLHLRQAVIIGRKYKLRMQYRDLHWPEMEPVLRSHAWIRKFEPLTDPTDGRALSRQVESVFLTPLGADWSHRPRRASSLILYGKPGTGKTSLMESLASSLDWPFLILSPPDFLRDGLEGFEARAAEIFDDLLRLRRVVVLFDECEEFFKHRDEKSQRLESRTAGAFITAGMLPRLQKLRKTSWIIFALATNSQLDELDDAVTRPGRFDYVQEIKFPTLESQIRFVTTVMGPSELSLRLAIKSLQKADTDLATKPVLVSFALLARFVGLLGDASHNMTQKKSDSALKRLLSGPQHLLHIA